MITELTEEQEAQLSVYRDSGLAIGNCTEPANFEIADTAMKDLYDFSENKMDKDFKIYHVDSPLSAQKLINELMGTEGKFYPTHFYGYGQHESYWIKNFQYYTEVLKIKIEDKAERGLDIMKRLCENSGVHYMFDTCAIICDRPEIIALDDNNVKHCEDGPCIRYKDGLEVYAIHDHVVPELVIMHPELITTDMIQKEENAETSRIMIERYGLENYLLDTEAKVLDADELNLEGSALRTLVEDKKGNRKEIISKITKKTRSENYYDNMEHR
jgi:hypothetical protein